MESLVFRPSWRHGSAHFWATNILGSFGSKWHTFCTIVNTPLGALRGFLSCRVTAWEAELLVLSASQAARTSPHIQSRLAASSQTQNFTCSSCLQPRNMGNGDWSSHITPSCHIISCHGGNQPRPLVSNMFTALKTWLLSEANCRNSSTHLRIICSESLGKILSRIHIKHVHIYSDPACKGSCSPAIFGSS